MTLQKSTHKAPPARSIKCPNCGSKKTTQYDQKTICANCSTVIDLKDLKNTKPKSKQFEHNHSQNMNTKPVADIDFGENGYKKWQKLLGVSDATEKRLATTLFEITKIGQSMSLPESTLKLALETYKKIINSNLTRRNPTRVLAAVIIYISCRQAGIATSLNQIAYLTKISPDKIRRVHNSLFKKMKPLSSPATSELYVSKLARSLFEQDKTIKLAEKIICAIKDQRFAKGKNPVSLAAASCYIASKIGGEAKTQREIAEIGRITQATMCTRYQEISKHLLFKIYL